MEARSIRSGAKRLLLVVGGDKGVESQAGATASRRPEGFVHVVGDEIETAVLSPVDGVIAGTGPVAVSVDESAVEGEEPEGVVDVELGFEGSLEFFEGGIAERFAELDKGFPVFLIAALHVVVFFVFLELVALVVESALAAG